ncbi:MAG: 5-bromo-4-chloroindolyl phosphate hydrolysis family protein [Clostridiaceae bacterium]|nr:5-bromo-4-chloroindolyl phosphate hydrolysis family protein [Clostridiaceae bacterium]
MGCKKSEKDNENCNNRGVAYSLVNLIFGMVSLSIKLAFKVVEVVFQTIFGLISLITGSRNSNKTPNIDKKSNVREFKKPVSSKTQADVPKVEKVNDSEEVKNKDIYVVLFILTIIPVIVTLAMGKLTYAGIIGASGLVLMIITGIATGIAGSIKKKASEKNTYENEEKPDRDDSVEKLIKDAFEKLFVIRRDIGKIADEDIRKRLEAICDTGEKIIGEVRTNPEGLTHVRKFFYYYIDAYGEIVKKYLRLSSFEESSEEIGMLVADTERAFTDIDGIFKDLCEKLLEKDMMHLKAEINVIKNSN